jgi:hypothetical protein
MGDATNLVLIFAGELLKRSEHLLTMGLHPSDVILGYEMALAKGREELESTLPLPKKWREGTSLLTKVYHSPRLVYDRLIPPTLLIPTRISRRTIPRLQTAWLREVPRLARSGGCVGCHAHEPQGLQC